MGVNRRKMEDQRRVAGHFFWRLIQVKVRLSIVCFELVAAFGEDAVWTGTPL
jgi:hypothetical protein